MRKKGGEHGWEREEGRGESGDESEEERGE